MNPRVNYFLQSKSIFRVLAITFLISCLFAQSSYASDINNNSLSESPQTQQTQTTKDLTHLWTKSILNLGVIKQSTLNAPDAEVLDEFGWSVALSERFLVIGAKNADLKSGNARLFNAGAVYVYAQGSDGWNQPIKLAARDAQSEDGFGTSVAIDRNTLVVGAPGHDEAGLEDAGAAYVFVYMNDEWIQQSKLTAADPAANDYFGSSVAIDGNTIVVGADGKDEGYLTDAGAAYIYIRNRESWKQQAKLIAEEAQFWEHFGTSVAISGNRVVIGANEAYPVGEPGVGAAYVFLRNGKMWSQEVRLSPEDGRRGDFFGHSVAISDDTVAIGALLSDPAIGDGRLINAGAVYVFSKINNEWKQRAKLVPVDAQPFDQFGQSVSIHGKYLLIGANQKNIDGQFGAGAAYLYSFKNNELELRTEIVAEQPKEYDAFGQSVALYGDILVIGAKGRNPQSITRAGEAFIFRLSTTELPETGFQSSYLSSPKLQPQYNDIPKIGEIWLEIPSLHIHAPIVGIPQTEGGWDVSWLRDQIGYLYGTAFPTWRGNTGLAAHVNLPDGAPGPFANLNQLKPGAKIFIYAWGQRYTYEVREIFKVSATDLSILKHEEDDWITLITCDDYDPSSGQFQGRLVVRAVFVNAENRGSN